MNIKQLKQIASEMAATLEKINEAIALLETNQSAQTMDATSGDPVPPDPTHPPQP